MRVYGLGLSADILKQAADVFRGEPDNGPPPSTTTPDHDVAVVVRDIDDERMLDILAGPARYVCALHDGAGIDAVRPPVTDGTDDTLIFEYLTTARVAYDLALSSVISQALKKRLGFEIPAQMNMEIALSEAITNALVHGCLDLDSPKDRFDPDFHAAIEDRIKDPAYMDTPIRIIARRAEPNMVSIAIHDNGAGFTPPEKSALQTPERLCRGLGLILSASEEMNFEDHGKCLEMKFSL